VKIDEMRSLPQLVRLSEAAYWRQGWEVASEEALECGDLAKEATIQTRLDEEVVEGVRLRDVTSLDSLAAKTRLASLALAWRWVDMQGAREEGASWDEIGRVAEITPQEAVDYYRAAIAEQEEYVQQHDILRARGALDDDPEL
jgi:hypothetical protein